MKGRKITIKNKAYPEPLKRIKEPPAPLYVRGTLPKGTYFGIVGTRRYSNYGKRAAFDIAAGLAEAGIVIVSGLAEGIDTFAHQGCLSAEGRTIAVLGTGTDEKSLYPKSNLDLSRRIVREKGSLLSEYPSGTSARRFHFPKRNRIISGLCCGILVIEAKKRSGALITADWAKKQKRRIFALPGSIYSLNSYGPNNLIKKGATAVTSARDILDKLNIKKKNEKGVQKRITFEGPEKKIAGVLKRGKAHIEKIIETTNMSPARVSALLSEMEAQGKIKNIKGNTYILKKKL